MAAYSVDSYVIQGSLADVISAIETKLETLDSTSNTLYLLEVKPIKTGSEWVGYMIYE